MQEQYAQADSAHQSALYREILIKSQEKKRASKETKNFVKQFKKIEKDYKKTHAWVLVLSDDLFAYERELAKLGPTSHVQGLQ